MAEAACCGAGGGWCVQEALKEHRDKVAGEKAAKEEEDRQFDEAVKEAKLKVG